MQHARSQLAAAGRSAPSSIGRDRLWKRPRGGRQAGEVDEANRSQGSVCGVRGGDGGLPSSLQARLTAAPAISPPDSPLPQLRGIEREVRLLGELPSAGFYLLDLPREEGRLTLGRGLGSCGFLTWLLRGTRFDTPPEVSNGRLVSSGAAGVLPLASRRRSPSSRRRSPSSGLMSPAASMWRTEV